MTQEQCECHHSDSPLSPSGSNAPLSLQAERIGGLVDLTPKHDMSEVLLQNHRQPSMDHDAVVILGFWSGLFC